MKKIISLIIVTIYLTGCSTAVSDDEIAQLNQQIGSLESQIEQLEEVNNQSVNNLTVLEIELSNFEGINMELVETNNLLEEELALAVETNNLLELALANEEVAEVEELDDNTVVDTKSYSQTGVLTGPYNGQNVMEAAYDFLWALHTGDLTIATSYINPVNPVYFSPSQNFIRNNLVTLTASDIANMATDTTVYNWGTEQGTNTPISMTISDYFDNYVYDEFYIQSPIIGQNIVVSNSSVTNVIADNFFYSIYNVEFMLPDYYTSDGAWKSITLSFIVEDVYPELIAVIHGY